MLCFVARGSVTHGSMIKTNQRNRQQAREKVEAYVQRDLQIRNDFLRDNVESQRMGTDTFAADFRLQLYRTIMCATSLALISVSPWYVIPSYDSTAPLASLIELLTAIPRM